MLRLYDLTMDGIVTPTTNPKSHAIFLGVPQDLILQLDNASTTLGTELYQLLFSTFGAFQLINIGELCEDGSYQVEFVNPVDIKQPDIKDSDILPNILQGVL